MDADKLDHWEYIGTYVDDLAIASKDPKSIVDTLTDKYRFKLKGTGPILYHLGCDFTRVEDGVLGIQPRKYIERMIETYVRMFGESPRRFTPHHSRKVIILNLTLPTCLMQTGSRSISP